MNFIFWWYRDIEIEKMKEIDEIKRCFWIKKKTGIVDRGTRTVEFLEFFVNLFYHPRLLHGTMPAPLRSETQPLGENPPRRRVEL